MQLEKPQAEERTREEGFEQNKVGRCLEVYHNMKCEECGWALLPHFLL
jgi:hypothetical protein